MGGPGGMLPRKSFKILHVAIAILVLFKKFLGKFYKNVFALNSDSLHLMQGFLAFFVTFTPWPKKSIIYPQCTTTAFLTLEIKVFFNF